MAAVSSSVVDEPVVPRSSSSSSSFLSDWACSSCNFRNNGQHKTCCSACGTASPLAHSHSNAPWVEGKSSRGRTPTNGKAPSKKIVASTPHPPNNPANSDYEGSGSSSPSSSSGGGLHVSHDFGGHLDLNGSTPHRRDPRLGPNADEDEKRATEEGRKVFVGNLKRPITRNEVVEHFSKFGEVERVILNSGFGLVLMVTREGALRATAERWQALDWRNVEVFIYQKGAKGASWNRPYAVPPRPGPCSRCGKESAEHCTLCTSALCLSEKSTCTACCRTCQRSFCLGGSRCGGNKDGLDTCDSCGALTCLFCALRLEATCGQCGHLFSDRIRENARHRAVKLVNLRIADNDGSVYALVCLLKGDMESSREGQLVAAIDRSSKLFDPQASSWCTLTALRAIKELDEAWEATRRVHNLRALRRSAKQWSTDLATLTMPSPPPQQQQPPLHHHSHHHHQQNGLMNGHRFVNAHTPVQFQPPSQQLPPMMGLNNNKVMKDELLFSNTLGSCEVFLNDFEPRPKAETDWLVANLKNVAFSLAQRKSRFIEELAARMEVWAALLRRVLMGPEASSFPVAPSSSLMAPMNKLKRAVVDLDTVYIRAASKEEFLMRKDALLAEVVKAARELKRTSVPGVAAVDMLLKRAGRSARNMEIRALSVTQGMLPFEACLHHCRYKKCSLPVGVLGGSCPFAHYAFGMDDGREFELAEYDFSNDPDELSLAVAASSMVRPGIPPAAEAKQHQPTSVWSAVPNALGWGSSSLSIPSPSQSIIASSFAPLAASIAKSAPTELHVPSTPLYTPSSFASSAGVSSNASFFTAADNWIPNIEPAAHKGVRNPVEGLTSAKKDATMDIPLQPMESLIPSDLDDVSCEPVVEPTAVIPYNHSDIVLQVAILFEELGLEGPVLLAQITAAFFASGAVKHARIWDTDVALLYKELLKIPNLPAAMRVKMLNLITERRGHLARLPAIGSLVVPPLL